MQTHGESSQKPNDRITDFLSSCGTVETGRDRTTKRAWLRIGFGYPLWLGEEKIEELTELYGEPVLETVLEVTGCMYLEWEVTEY